MNGSVVSVESPVELLGTEPVESQESVPIKVVVIDDELAGLVAFHINDIVRNFHETLGDSTSPEFEELWRLTVELGGLPDIHTYTEEKKKEYLFSDNFVSSVALNAQFDALLDEQFKQWLSPFFERAKKIAHQRTAIEEAFCSPDFDLQFLRNRPTKASDLLQYDLIVFDLVLQKSTGAVDELVEYLKALSAAEPDHLPGIIVMSSRAELIQERTRFSTDSNISAAGLILLPKGEVFKENFGAAGIRLSYQQLKRQRDVAQLMRKFMSAWTSTLAEAQKKAMTTLWNLDAAAMQEIHLSASLDSDPYDGHLSEFMAKEYLWHVEGSTEVSAAIAQLDCCFKQQFNTETSLPVIATRFMAPFVNPSVSRNLVSHFTWSNFPLIRDLFVKTDDDIRADFNQVLPFGTVLAPAEAAASSDFLIHITQQCDILSVVRSADQGFTAKFAIARAIEVKDGHIPEHSNEDIVAKGLKLDAKEYDLKLVKGSIFAVPVDMLLTHLRAKNYSVVGRLRHEIATQFLVGTANHMTRPAAIKTTRSQVHMVNLYLYGESLPNGPLVPYTREGSEPVSVGMTRKDKSLYFSDDYSMHIALWVKGLVDPNYSKSLDAQKACDALSVGVPNNSCIVSIVNLQFVEVSMSAEELKSKFPAKDPKIKDKVRLVAICQAAAS